MQPLPAPVAVNLPSGERHQPATRKSSAHAAIRGVLSEAWGQPRNSSSAGPRQVRYLVHAYMQVVGATRAKRSIPVMGSPQFVEEYA